MTKHGEAWTDLGEKIDKAWSLSGLYLPLIGRTHGQSMDAGWKSIDKAWRSMEAG